MIDRNLQPVEWAAFLYELADAKEHLETLLKELEKDVDYDESDLRVDLGHVYAHLNRAWRRSMKEVRDDEWHQASQFPDDLMPI
jgi:hypothetical protein